MPSWDLQNCIMNFLSFRVLPMTTNLKTNVHNFQSYNIEPNLFCKQSHKVKDKYCKTFIGRRPGLLVVGGDSCPRGREFKSQRRLLDGSFLPFICCKIVTGSGQFKPCHGLVTFCCGHQTAWWRPVSCGLGWAFVTPVKAIMVGVNGALKNCNWVWKRVPGKQHI